MLFWLPAGAAQTDYGKAATCYCAANPITSASLCSSQKLDPTPTRNYLPSVQHDHAVACTKAVHVHIPRGSHVVAAVFGGHVDHAVLHA